MKRSGHKVVTEPKATENDLRNLFKQLDQRVEVRLTRLSEKTIKMYTQRYRGNRGNRGYPNRFHCPSNGSPMGRPYNMYQGPTNFQHQYFENRFPDNDRCSSYQEDRGSHNYSYPGRGWAQHHAPNAGHRFPHNANRRGHPEKRYDPFYAQLVQEERAKFGDGFSADNFVPNTDSNHSFRDCNSYRGHKSYEWKAHKKKLSLNENKLPNTNTDFAAKSKMRRIQGCKNNVQSETYKSVQSFGVVCLKAKMPYQLLKGNNSCNRQTDKSGTANSVNTKKTTLAAEARSLQNKEQVKNGVDENSSSAVGKPIGNQDIDSNEMSPSVISPGEAPASRPNVASSSCISNSTSRAIKSIDVIQPKDNRIIMNTNKDNTVQSETLKCPITNSSEKEMCSNERTSLSNTKKRTAPIKESQEIYSKKAKLNNTLVISKGNDIKSQEAEKHIVPETIGSNVKSNVPILKHPKSKSVTTTTLETEYDDKMSRSVSPAQENDSISHDHSSNFEMDGQALKDTNTISKKMQLNGRDKKMKHIFNSITSVVPVNSLSASRTSNVENERPILNTKMKQPKLYDKPDDINGMNLSQDQHSAFHDGNDRSKEYASDVAEVKQFSNPSKVSTLGNTSKENTSTSRKRRASSVDENRKRKISDVALNCPESNKTKLNVVKVKSNIALSGVQKELEAASVTTECSPTSQSNRSTCCKEDSRITGKDAGSKHCLSVQGGNGTRSDLHNRGDSVNIDMEDMSSRCELLKSVEPKTSMKPKSLSHLQKGRSVSLDANGTHTENITKACSLPDPPKERSISLDDTSNAGNRVDTSRMKSQSTCKPSLDYKRKVVASKPSMSFKHKFHHTEVNPKHIKKCEKGSTSKSTTDTNLGSSNPNVVSSNSANMTMDSSSKQLSKQNTRDESHSKAFQINDKNKRASKTNRSCINTIEPSLFETSEISAKRTGDISKHMSGNDLLGAQIALSPKGNTKTKMGHSDKQHPTLKSSSNINHEKYKINTCKQKMTQVNERTSEKGASNAKKSSTSHKNECNLTVDIHVRVNNADNTIIKVNNTDEKSVKIEMMGLDRNMQSEPSIEALSQSNKKINARSSISHEKKLNLNDRIPVQKNEEDSKISKTTNTDWKPVKIEMTIPKTNIQCKSSILQTVTERRPYISKKALKGKSLEEKFCLLFGEDDDNLQPEQVIHLPNPVTDVCISEQYPATGCSSVTNIEETNKKMTHTLNMEKAVNEVISEPTILHNDTSVVDVQESTVNVPECFGNSFNLNSDVVDILFPSSNDIEGRLNVTEKCSNLKVNITSATALNSEVQQTSRELVGSLEPMVEMNPHILGTDNALDRIIPTTNGTESVNDTIVTSSKEVTPNISVEHAVEFNTETNNANRINKHLKSDKGLALIPGKESKKAGASGLKMQELNNTITVEVSPSTSMTGPIINTIVTPKNKPTNIVAEDALSNCLPTTLDARTALDEENDLPVLKVEFPLIDLCKEEVIDNAYVLPDDTVCTEKVIDTTVLPHNALSEEEMASTILPESTVCNDKLLDTSVLEETVNIANNNLMPQHLHDKAILNNPEYDDNNTSIETSSITSNPEPVFIYKIRVRDPKSLGINVPPVELVNANPIGVEDNISTFSTTTRIADVASTTNTLQISATGAPTVINIPFNVSTIPGINATCSGKTSTSVVNDVSVFTSANDINTMPCIPLTESFSTGMNTTSPVLNGVISIPQTGITSSISTTSCVPSIGIGTISTGVITSHFHTTVKTTAGLSTTNDSPTGTADIFTNPSETTDWKSKCFTELVLTLLRDQRRSNERISQSMLMNTSIAKHERECAYIDFDKCLTIKSKMFGVLLKALFGKLNAEIGRTIMQRVNAFSPGENFTILELLSFVRRIDHILKSNKGINIPSTTQEIQSSNPNEIDQLQTNSVQSKSVSAVNISQETQTTLNTRHCMRNVGNTILSTVSVQDFEHRVNCNNIPPLISIPSAPKSHLEWHLQGRPSTSQARDSNSISEYSMNAPNNSQVNNFVTESAFQPQNSDFNYPARRVLYRQPNDQFPNLPQNVSQPAKLPVLQQTSNQPTCIPGGSVPQQDMRPDLASHSQFMNHHLPRQNTQVDPGLHTGVTSITLPIIPQFTNLQSVHNPQNNQIGSMTLGGVTRNVVPNTMNGSRRNSTSHLINVPYRSPQQISLTDAMLVTGATPSMFPNTTCVPTSSQSVSVQGAPQTIVDRNPHLNNLLATKNYSSNTGNISNSRTRLPPPYASLYPVPLEPGNIRYTKICSNPFMSPGNHHINNNVANQSTTVVPSQAVTKTKNAVQVSALSAEQQCQSTATSGRSSEHCANKQPPIQHGSAHRKHKLPQQVSRHRAPVIPAPSSNEPRTLVIQVPSGNQGYPQISNAQYPQETVDKHVTNAGNPSYSNMPNQMYGNTCQQATGSSSVSQSIISFQTPNYLQSNNPGIVHSSHGCTSQPARFGGPITDQTRIPPSNDSCNRLHSAQHGTNTYRPMSDLNYSSQADNQDVRESWQANSSSESIHSQLTRSVNRSVANLTSVPTSLRQFRKHPIHAHQTDTSQLYQRVPSLPQNSAVNDASVPSNVAQNQSIPVPANLVNTMQNQTTLENPQSGTPTHAGNFSNDNTTPRMSHVLHDKGKEQSDTSVGIKPSAVEVFSCINGVPVRNFPNTDGTSVDENTRAALPSVLPDLQSNIESAAYVGQEADDVLLANLYMQWLNQ